MATVATGWTRRGSLAAVTDQRTGKPAVGSRVPLARGRVRLHRHQRSNQTSPRRHTMNPSWGSTPDSFERLPNNPTRASAQPAVQTTLDTSCVSCIMGQAEIPLVYSHRPA